MKTQTTIRVEENSYAQAKDILRKIGLCYSQTIGVLNNGLPFDVKNPTKETRKAMQDDYRCRS